MRVDFPSFLNFLLCLTSNQNVYFFKDNRFEVACIYWSTGCWWWWTFLLVFHSNNICWIIVRYEVIDDCIFFSLCIVGVPVVEILLSDVNVVSFNEMVSLISATSLFLNASFSRSSNSDSVSSGFPTWPIYYIYSLYIISILQIGIKLFLWITFTVNVIYTWFLKLFWNIFYENNFFQISLFDRIVPNFAFDNYICDPLLRWNEMKWNVFFSITFTTKQKETYKLSNIHDKKNIMKAKLWRNALDG